MSRCIVPGWPQYCRGDHPRAVAFLISYLLLLLPGVVLAGTWLGSVLLGLAGAMHIVSVSDALVTSFATPGDRIAFTLACGLVLCLVVYLPIGWLISRVATPIRVMATIPPFQQGDVLWYSRLDTPDRGDWVLYTLPGLRVSGRTTAGNNAQYVFQGQWIGRVIAEAGQTVAVNEGRWQVEGLESEWQPLSATRVSDGTAWIVPEGHAFVLPDGLVPAGAQLNNELMQQISFVPLTRIAGRLYFRSLPLSQMSTLD